MIGGAECAALCCFCSEEPLRERGLARVRCVFCCEEPLRECGLARALPVSLAAPVDGRRSFWARCFLRRASLTLFLRAALLKRVVHGQTTLFPDFSDSVIILRL